MIADDEKAASRDSEFESTEVDLGDDLIAQPLVHSASNSETENQTGSNLDEELKNARILLNEGFIEDAKKVLRKVLVQDAKRVVAKEMLQEIQNLEIKKIFAEQQTRTILSDGMDPFDVGEVIQSLESDLHVSLADELTPESRATAEQMYQSVVVQLKPGCPQVRIGLGIAFYEFGALDQSILLLRAAIAESTDEFTRLSATGVLAYVLFEKEDYFESMRLLQPVVDDGELSLEQRVHFFYLMGRVQEALGKTDLAGGWYEAVRNVDPNYRDISERC